MNDPQFSTWWDYAKNLNEFRGVSMPAAYAAWLAGAASVTHTGSTIPLNGNTTIPPKAVMALTGTDEEIAAEISASGSIPAKPKRRAGKYRAEEAG